MFAQDFGGSGPAGVVSTEVTAAGVVSTVVSTVGVVSSFFFFAASSFRIFSPSPAGITSGVPSSSFEAFSSGLNAGGVDVVVEDVPRRCI